MNNENFSDYSENPESQTPINPILSNEIDCYLSELAVPEPDQRRTSLCSILAREGLDYTIQEIEPTEKNPHGVQNYIVTIGNSQEPHLLFCAHYDAFPASCGANDNSAAVCILINLAKELERQNITAEFAFFDGEESKHLGSKLYVQNMDKKSITAVINLDICGYGDTIAIYNHGRNSKFPMHNFCHKSRLLSHNAKIVKYLPESDDIAFNGSRIPTLNIAIMPKWDTTYLKALASYGNNIIGQPPEFEMILGQMEVISTIHGNFRDKVSSIQPSAMQQVYDYLFDSVTQPLPSKNLFHLF